MNSKPVLSVLTQRGIGLAMSLLAAASPLSATKTLAETVQPASGSALAQTTELAQATVAISENPNLIRVCRRTNREVPLFSNTALTPANRIGTAGPNTEVTLTGIVGQGIAQVFYLAPNQTVVVGWLQSANLAPCQPTPPVTRACYRADTTLTVRNRPGTSSPSVPIGEVAAGRIVFATTNPPTTQAADTRTWLQITFANGSGWVSLTGPNNQGFNLTRLASCP